MLNLKSLAEMFESTKEDLLALAKQARITITHNEVLDCDYVDSDGAARLQTAVTRKRAGWPLLRTNDRVRWQGFGPSIGTAGTVQTAELPGDLRALVLWDGSSTAVWTSRDTLVKIKKVKR